MCLDDCYLVEYKEKRKRTRSKVVWGVYYLMQLGDEAGQIKRHKRGGGISAVAKERCTVQNFKEVKLEIKRRMV